MCWWRQLECDVKQFLFRLHSTGKNSFWKQDSRLRKILKVRYIFLLALAPSCKMSYWKKRKVNTEGLVFPEKWNSSYTRARSWMGILCAWCARSKFQCSRNSNIWCNYGIQHGEKYNSLHRELRKPKVDEMLMKMLRVWGNSNPISPGAERPVMEVVVQTVNFCRARGLKHRQFDTLLSDCSVTRGLHTTLKWEC